MSQGGKNMTIEHMFESTERGIRMIYLSYDEMIALQALFNNNVRKSDHIKNIEKRLQREIEAARHREQIRNS